MTTLDTKLETLLAAYEAKGHRVTDSLLTGLSRESIDELTTWFPLPLPEELYQLYGWRNGQTHDAWAEEYPFWFRDNAFCNLAHAEEVYRNVVSVYAEHNKLILECFPFAEFSGECYLLQCSPPIVTSRPVVDLIGDTYFLSLDTLIETCIDWVRHPRYSGHESLDRDVELEIWCKHNPGLFA